MDLQKSDQILDVVLIGSGVMSANLGALLKSINSSLKIELYEVTKELSFESSNGWNNAGTGHAGICELSYTPDCGPDGKVRVEKAIEILRKKGQKVAAKRADSCLLYTSPSPRDS